MHLADMLDAIEKILSISGGLSVEQFLEDKVRKILDIEKQTNAN